MRVKWAEEQDTESKMASELALSTARSGEICVGREMRDSFSLLDVLYANQFKGESLDPKVVVQTEETFYRGAPPEWLNFHISEQAESDGTGTSFIKRDGYDSLKQQIQNKRKLPGISTVKLFHQPGCGGTTLAMQVLWDLRRSFRCAVLTGSTSDIMNVATEVVHLFTAGSRGNQNTVLLLLNDEHILENLQDSIMEKMVQQRIVTNIPVVIFFTCVRKEVLQSDHVILQKALSDTEKQKFDEKKKELSRKYRDKCGQFHGFNIMQTNFSQAYVKQACTVFSTVQRANKPLKTQLATFLSLLNAYVPGSYLLESQCLEFLKHEDSIHGHLSLEDRMEPFSHLIITFQHDVRSGKKVCMAHPMIAQCCTELMGEADVTRSDTARSFLNSLCRDEIPPRLLSFVKDMLTKREMKVEENPKKRINGNEIKEDRERFSRLILDIQRKESEVQSASVLKMASMIFLQNPFFPQALARFYYIELKDYNQAERWAKEAKERDPKNSFVADTLGQVYKNHLKNKDFSAKPRESLKLAKKAIQAFKDEDQLAENEHGADMKEDGNTKVSHIFNIRGQFGYLQVCNIVYDQLVTQNETWKKVLTKNVSMGSVLGSLGDNKLYRFNGLISSLRDEVEKKCNFLNAYLTFSKPGIQKDDPSYIQKDVSSCYCKYTEHPLPDLIRDVMNTFGDNVEENMSPSDADTPEPPIVGLLKEWPGDNNSPSDLMLFVQKINHSYDSAYAKYFQSRYLCPLFYLGEDEALSRIAPTNNSQFLLENDDATTDFINYMMNNDKIFKDLRVNKKLLKFHGVVQNYKLFAAIGGMKVMVNANMRDSLWIQRDVSFYLGFTIRGLVAFGIQTENNKLGPTRSCDSCGSVKDSNWTAATPERRTENALPIYRMQSEAGRFKCSVSGLRWVCKKKVSFTYQFKSWEEHWQKLNMVHCKPGGPLMDITVTDGELDEVHLPHWVCMDGLAKVSGKFAVLHKGQSGNFLEEVSEVTSSHVRLFQPSSFSTNAVLIKAGFPMKAHCNVLIYRTNQKQLTLHIYVIVCDPARQQEVEQVERARGSRMIQKPNPEKSLETLESFILTTDADSAEISVVHSTPNFFEVFIKNAESNVKLKLEDEEKHIVWTCAISKDEYQN
ncbi:sterile alpha motif domain-containing protein 9-like [Thunnus maccoyii]|uniref:sterile alpha motif domain-containing protein 9-like n=1 Tax=Thunnus maccoyii TaxID=8240 RepID=UPI001C4CABE7|nr:sterile alpha motif domain-containing protein 9-like [Thunnus maccoyii]